LLLGLVLFAPAVGCLQFRPTGPIFGGDAAEPQLKPSKTNPNAMIAVDGTAVPVLPDAPPPPAPAHLVSPGEIDVTNHKDAVRKLMEEIQLDQKAADQFPNYSSVSKVERGK
jgi:hypothetical protein